MKARRSCFFILFCSVFLLLLLHSQPGLTAPDDNEVASSDTKGEQPSARVMTRRYDPVEVEGKYLEAFWGKDLSRFNLFSWRRGSFSSIPFQIDERKSNGEMVLPFGPEGRPQDGNGRLDPQDILVFMVSDVGTKVQEAAYAGIEGETMEIELLDLLRDEKGYVYLNWDKKRESPETFPSKVELIPSTEDKPYSLKYRTGMVVGRTNRIGDRVFETPVYDSWFCNPETGGNGTDLVDAMKVRIKVGFLFNTLKFSVDETSILGGVEAGKIGPVRCFGRFWIRAMLPLGLKSPRGHMDVYLYDTMVLVPGKIKIFMNPGYVMSSFEIMFGYDLTENALGMKFYNSNNPEGFLVDGSMDDREKKMDTRLDEWRAVVGPQGGMITSSVWDKDYKEQANIEVHYLDDKQEELPPEDEPGSIGYHYNLSTVKSLKHGSYKMLLSWFYPEHMYDPDRFRIEVVEECLDVRKRPLQVHIGEHSFPNPAGWPPMILGD